MITWVFIRNILK